MADKARKDAAQKYAKASAQASSHLLVRAAENLNNDLTYNGMDYDMQIIHSAVEVELRPKFQSFLNNAWTRFGKKAQ